MTRSSQVVRDHIVDKPASQIDTSETLQILYFELKVLMSVTFSFRHTEF